MLLLSTDLYRRRSAVGADLLSLVVAGMASGDSGSILCRHFGHHSEFRRALDSTGISGDAAQCARGSKWIPHHSAVRRWAGFAEEETDSRRSHVRTSHLQAADWPTCA